MESTNFCNFYRAECGLSCSFTHCIRGMCVQNKFELEKNMHMSLDLVVMYVHLESVRSNRTKKRNRSKRITNFNKFVISIPVELLLKNVLSVIQRDCLIERCCGFFLLSYSVYGAEIFVVSK